MKKIDGWPKSLRQLLENTRYTIHYYQREYRWGAKQIDDLIDDLTTEFLEYYRPGDPRIAVRNYGSYFMGPIVLADSENAIIDGQQRLTTMTLLMIYLDHRLQTAGQSSDLLKHMIYQEAYGERTFNIDDEDRKACIEALLNQQEIDESAANETEKNIYRAYQYIEEEAFPTDTINDGMLLHFCDWLTEKVVFIEIVAATEQDAHKVFVTMNDRGLRLTSTEMLKGYLLSEVREDDTREELNEQ